MQFPKLSTAFRARSVASVQLRYASTKPCTSYTAVTHSDKNLPKEVEDRVKQLSRFTVNTYARPSLIFVRGEGCKVWDSLDREYLDLSAGIAVNAFGHADPGVSEVIADQSQKLMHGSNLYLNEWSGQLARSLVESTLTFGGLGFEPSSSSQVADESSESPLKVFFSNSGTESNEAAIKFARKASHGTPGKTDFVCFNNGFHGRTYGALSATAQEKYQAPFAPLVPGFKVGTFNNIDSINELVTPKTCGVIIEPIQGEGGIFEASQGFLQALRKRCDEVGAVLIFDEIQCGLGRTGKLWAHSELPTDCHPDIVTMAKPLANGIPIGAVLTRNWVADAIKVGDHGTTFGGGALQCRVGHHVLTRIANPNFLSHVTQKGKHLSDRLTQLSTYFPKLVAGPIRGRGLIQGLPMANDELPGKLVALARERGVLLITCGNRTVRFVPSLNISIQELDKAVDVVESCLSILNE